MDAQALQSLPLDSPRPLLFPLLPKPQPPQSCNNVNSLLEMEQPIPTSEFTCQRHSDPPSKAILSPMPGPPMPTGKTPPQEDKFLPPLMLKQ
jgi:hypothetical protein